MATTNTVATLLIRLMGDMKGLDNTFKKAKQEVRGLEKAFKTASSGIVAANSGIKKSTKSMAESVKNSTKVASQGLSKLSSDYKKSVSKIDSANKSKSSSGGTGFKGILDKHGANAAIGFGAVAGGIGSAFYKATKQFSEFDVAVKRAGVISGATADEMKILEKSALDLSTTTGFAASEIAEGMATMARMGFQTNKILAAMPHILDASIVAGERFDTVLNVVESTLAAFNMKGEETQHVVDTLTKATNLSRAKFKSLGEVLKYAAPAAHDLGISLEELSAAAAIMIQNGKQGGIAGRTLRAALQRLSAPTEAAQIELSKLGVTIKDEHGNMRNFGTILNELHDGLQGYGNAQKVAALKTIFGMEASSGMLSVVNEAPGKFKEWTEALEKAGGVTKEFADKIKGESIAYQLDMLKRTVEKAAIQLGKYLAPSIAKVSNAIKKVVNWFLNLNEGTKKSIVRILELTAAFASLGFAISVAGKVAKYALAPFKLMNLALEKLVVVSGNKGATGSVTGLSSAIRGPLVNAFRLLATPAGAILTLLAAVSSVFKSVFDDIEELENKKKQQQKKIEDINEELVQDQKKTNKVVSKVPYKRGMGPQPKKQFSGAMPFQKGGFIPNIPTDHEQRLENIKKKWDAVKNSIAEMKNELVRLLDKLGVIDTFKRMLDGLGKALDWTGGKLLHFGDWFVERTVEKIGKFTAAIRFAIGLLDELTGKRTIPTQPYEKRSNGTYYIPGRKDGTPWGGPTDMSYNNNNTTTFNVYPKHFDPRRYNAQEYWRKTGGVRV